MHTLTTITTYSERTRADAYERTKQSVDGTSYIGVLARAQAYAQAYAQRASSWSVGLLLAGIPMVLGQVQYVATGDTLLRE
jgi:hypothetical protein